MQWLGWLVWAVAPGAVGMWLLLLWWQQSRPDRVAVLCYHRLVPGDSRLTPEMLTADPEPSWVAEQGRFAEQVAWLAQNGYTALDLDDWLAIRKGEMAQPKRSVLFTFDDGYGSVIEVAAPILAQHRMKATIFAVLEPDEHSCELVVGKDRFLRPDELRTLADAGWSIQSHTVTHAMLPYLDDANLDRELTESMRRLGEIAGHPVRHICLPRGGVDARVVEHAKRAGYQTCCGIAKGTARFSADPLQLPRLSPLRHHGAAAMARMLSPLGATLEVAMARLRIVIPRLFGAKVGYRLRTFLYSSALRHLLGPRVQARTLAALVGVWMLGGVWFFLRVLTGS